MNFIINKEEYLCTIAAWNKIANRNATDHIFYNALRGHDLKRGFSPIQSENKIAAGLKPWQSFDTAKYDAWWKIRDNAAMWSHDTLERRARREAEEKERIDSLSKKYGTTFTQELITTLRELLK